MNKWLLILLFAVGLAQAQNTIVFTAETTTGTEVVTPVLSWSTSPAADSCVASGDWSGEKGAAGSETLPDITSSATYNLTCSWQDRAVTLTWTPPTENTDGSPLTDLAGYKIYQGDSPGNYNGPVYDLSNPGLASFVVEPLAAGTYYFVSTAYNSNGIESVFSNEAFKEVGASSSVRSVGIQVNPRPNAPSTLGAS